MQWLFLAADASSVNYFCRTVLGDKFYQCEITHTNFTHGDALVVIDGQHKPGYGDRNVDDLTVSTGVNFSEFPDAFFDKFYNVKHVFMEKIGLVKFGENSFRSSGQMEKLRLGKNQLKEIPDRGFKTCRNLNTLELQNNKISALGDDAFFGLRILSSLDLSNNELKEIGSETFRPLGSLLDLNLDRNYLRAIHPQAFDNLKSLLNLRLSGNRLSAKSIGQVFKNLSSLSALSLDENFIESISYATFEGLTGLKLLNLGGNNLREIPANAFKPLQSLHMMELENSGISKLDCEAFNGLRNLQRLNLNKNGISHLCPELFEPMELIEIRLSENKLTEIDNKVFAGLASLDRLEMNSNELHNVVKPETMSHLVNLTKLEIKYIGLEEIPAQTFTALRNIENINLSGNKFQRLSEFAFGNLPKLHKLDVFDCGINQISQTFFDYLPNLIRFSANSNICVNQMFSVEGNQSIAEVYAKELLPCFDNNVDSLTAVEPPMDSSSAAFHTILYLISLVFVLF